MQTLYIIFVICKVQSFIFTRKWKLWIPPDIGSINLVILMVGETVAPTEKPRKHRVNIPIPNRGALLCFEPKNLYSCEATLPPNNQLTPKVLNTCRLVKTTVFVWKCYFLPAIIGSVANVILFFCISSLSRGRRLFMAAVSSSMRLSSSNRWGTTQHQWGDKPISP